MNNKKIPPAQFPPQKKAAALRYRPEQDDTPKLVAKGSGFVAQKMIDQALEHGVHIEEDPSLVEVLSKLDLHENIPPELYQLVAEILSFVYKLDGQMKP